MGPNPEDCVRIRRDQDTDAHRGTHVRTREGTAVLTPRREASGGTSPATPCSRTSSLQTAREYMSAVLCYGRPRTSHSFIPVSRDGQHGASAAGVKPGPPHDTTTCSPAAAPPPSGTLLVPAERPFQHPGPPHGRGPEHTPDGNTPPGSPGAQGPCELGERPEERRAHRLRREWAC